MGKSLAESIISHGILNINKPLGWTSHDVVAKVRAMLKGPKVGHAGTLDPAASGVLPILIGRGTRVAEYLLSWDKEYHAVLRLGEVTDTQDATGSVLARRSTEGLTEEAIRATVARFQGRLTQLPPMYSAVKVSGMPLYKAARSGKIVERVPREVMIHKIEVLKIDSRDISLHVHCSKGTYIRTLCADIGDALGVGGHLLTLVRTRVGPFPLRDSLCIQDLPAMYLTGQLAEAVISLDEALKGLPDVVVDDAAAIRVRHGGAVSFKAVQWNRWPGLTEAKTDRPVRIKDTNGRLLAIGVVSAGALGHAREGSIAITKVLVDA